MRQQTFFGQPKVSHARSQAKVRANAKNISNEVLTPLFLQPKKKLAPDPHTPTNRQILALSPTEILEIIEIQ